MINFFRKASELRREESPGFVVRVVLAGSAGAIILLCLLTVQVYISGEEFYNFLTISLSIITGFISGIVISAVIRKKFNETEDLISTLDNFESLEQNTPCVSFQCIHDDDRTLLYVSDKIEEYTGYPPSDFIYNRKRSFKSILTEKDLPKVEQALNSVISSDSSYSIIYNVRHRDGKLRKVRESGKLTLDANLGVLTFYGLITEIREYHEKDCDKGESQNIYRSLFECTGDAIFTMRGNIFIECNKKTLEIFGCGYEDIINSSPDQFSPRFQPDGSDSFLMAKERIQKTFDGDPQVFEWVHSKLDGTPFWAEVSLTRVDISGEFYILAIVRDISVRKEYEAKIKESEQKIRAISNQTFQFMGLLEADGRVIHINDTALKFAGVSAEEVIGKYFWETSWWSHSEEHQKKLKIAITKASKGEFLRFETEHIGADGKLSYVDFSIKPVKDDNGDVILLIPEGRDITELKRSREVMVQTEKMMSLGGITAGIAHEIKNPLGGIIQNAQIIRNRYSDDIQANLTAAEECGIELKSLRQYLEKRKITSMLESILDSGERAAGIINDLLSFSRESVSDNVLCHINEILDKAIDLVSQDYDVKKHYDFRKIKILREYDDVSELKCEKNKIRQVFFNILKNGAEAMTDAGTEKPTFYIRTREEQGKIIIEIEDNGPGIEPEVKKHIFQPFFTTKGEGIGTGLGLSVSNFIVSEGMGGEIQVESDPGGGTKFIVVLPVMGIDQA